MNKRKYISFLLIIVFYLFSYTGYGQMAGPGEPNGEPELSDPPLGGNAPISGGAVLLLIMGAAYGCRKLYRLRNIDLNEGQDTLS